MNEKVQLNEYLNKRKLPFAVYKTDTRGSEHNKDFKSIITINGLDIASTWKKTKKESEKECAKFVLDYLASIEGQPIEIIQQIKPLSNQLSVLENEDGEEHEEHDNTCINNNINNNDKVITHQNHHNYLHHHHNHQHNNQSIVISTHHNPLDFFSLFKKYNYPTPHHHNPIIKSVENENTIMNLKNTIISLTEKINKTESMYQNQIKQLLDIHNKLTIDFNKLKKYVYDCKVETIPDLSDFMTNIQTIANECANREERVLLEHIENMTGKKKRINNKNNNNHSNINNNLNNNINNSNNNNNNITNNSNSVNNINNNDSGNISKEKFNQMNHLKISIRDLIREKVIDKDQLEKYIEKKQKQHEDQQRRQHQNQQKEIDLNDRQNQDNQDNQDNQQKRMISNDKKNKRKRIEDKENQTNTTISNKDKNEYVEFHPNKVLKNIDTSLAEAESITSTTNMSTTNTSTTNLSKPSTIITRKSSRTVNIS